MNASIFDRKSVLSRLAKFSTRHVPTAVKLAWFISLAAGDESRGSSPTESINGVHVSTLFPPSVSIPFEAARADLPVEERVKN